jgi:hypothetical protein
MKVWGVVASCVALLGLPAAVPAQVALQPAAPASEAAPLDADQRAAQLKAVVASVTTPDRERNIANFEQLMESNDARRIELAVRTLVASDDAVLRGMAMRGYVAVTRDLVLQVALSPAEMKVLQEARTADRVGQLSGANGHLQALNQVLFKFTLTFEPTSIREPRGKVVAAANKAYTDYVSTYAVRGDRITFTTRPAFNWSACDFELAPRKDATIVGTMTCPNSNIQVPVHLIAPMF